MFCIRYCNVYFQPLSHVHFLFKFLVHIFCNICSNFLPLSLLSQVSSCRKGFTCMLVDSRLTSRQCQICFVMFIATFSLFGYCFKQIDMSIGLPVFGIMSSLCQGKSKVYLQCLQSTFWLEKYYWKKTT